MKKIPLYPRTVDSSPGAWLLAILSIAVVVAILLFGGKVHARDLNVIVTPPSGGIVVTPNGATIVAPLQDASPHVIHVPETSPSLADRVRALRWEIYCKPTFRQDEWGVTHYVFAKKGCEFGKDHD